MASRQPQRGMVQPFHLLIRNHEARRGVFLFFLFFLALVVMFLLDCAHAGTFACPVASCCCAAVLLFSSVVGIAGAVATTHTAVALGAHKSMIVGVTLGALTVPVCLDN